MQIVPESAPAAALDPVLLAASAVVNLPGGGPDNLPPAARYALLHADDLKNLPPVAWLIKAQIPRSGLTLVYGPAGAGKSFLALDYAFQVAQAATVVYVAAEGVAGYAARVLAWTNHHHQAAGQLFFADRAVNLLDPGDVDAFLAAISPLAPALVVLDTLARCLIGGDENSARDMGLAIASCDCIRAAGGEGGAGRAVLLVHHSTKAGNTERGSGALKAACDHVLRLDNDDGLLTLGCEKTKDAAAPEPRHLRLLAVETGRQTEEGEAETSCVTVPADKIVSSGTLSSRGRKILEKLALEVFSETGARAAALQEAVNLNRSSLYSAISQLLRDGYVTQDAKGEPFHISERGRKAVR